MAVIWFQPGMLIVALMLPRLIVLAGEASVLLIVQENIAEATAAVAAAVLVHQELIAMMRITGILSTV
jgi:hypothetical protein